MKSKITKIKVISNKDKISKIDKSVVYKISKAINYNFISVKANNILIKHSKKDKYLNYGDISTFFIIGDYDVQLLNKDNK